MTKDELRSRIEQSLLDQGFHLTQGEIHPPTDLSKSKIRNLHQPATRARRERLKKYYKPHEDAYLDHIADGSNIDPRAIVPTLYEVSDPSSFHAQLFRYITLHWSIPVSSGYGRRLRYLVVDASTNCVMGLFGLGDPIFALGDRDEWIGWDSAARKRRLRHVVDAFVLGAVPPYSQLLGGKLIAMLACSNEVRLRFQDKYEGRSSRISGEPHDGRLALITTTSALGRSSLYNRIRLDGRTLYHRVGETSGSGEFHFANGLYKNIRAFVEEHAEATRKKESWGTGFRNRREVVRKCLSLLDLPSQWIYHGVQREIYASPLAQNAREFLRGGSDELEYFDHSQEEMFSWFRKRWLLPRAKRRPEYSQFRPNQYRIWCE